MSPEEHALIITHLNRIEAKIDTKTDKDHCAELRKICGVNSLAKEMTWFRRLMIATFFASLAAAVLK